MPLISLLLVVGECLLQARQRSGLINVRRFDETGAAVCFVLIGGAFPIIGRMISMRVVHSDIYETFLAGP